MQAVGPIVEEQLILLPIDSEPPLRNPVGNTPYDGTEEGVLPCVTWLENSMRLNGRTGTGWVVSSCAYGLRGVSASPQYETGDCSPGVSQDTAR